MMVTSVFPPEVRVVGVIIKLSLFTVQVSDNAPGSVEKLSSALRVTTGVASFTYLSPSTVFHAISVTISRDGLVLSFRLIILFVWLT